MGNQKSWEQLSENQWPTAKQWINIEESQPLEEWIPDPQWETSEIESMILNEVDLDENQSLLVVFAHLASDSPNSEVLTQPYGIIFMQE